MRNFFIKFSISSLFFISSKLILVFKSLTFELFTNDDKNDTIISFEDTVYMPVEFFAEAYDISYKYLPEHDFIVLYKNLVQLENPSVPNQLSRD